MQLIKRVSIYFILALFVNSCIEPYIPEGLDYEPMLFIQALVTDGPDSHASVRLSNTSPLNNNEGDVIEYVSVSGATVYIERDDNAKYYLNEQGSWWGFGNGVYTLNDPTFILSEDYKYKLVITTSEGYQLESDYEPYLPSTPVDNINYQYDRQKATELDQESEGYKFFVSTSGSGDEPSYFRWQLDETYIYYSSFIGNYKWNGTSLDNVSSFDYRKCFKDENIKGIYIGSTDDLSENVVTDAPLHFVSQYGDKLSIEYSLHVNQYRISKGAFQFWFDMKKLIYESGGLYETQPFKISGNINCISDPKINVAGIFEIAGVSEKRVFVPPPSEFNIYYSRCMADTIGTDRLTWDMIEPGSWVHEIDVDVYMTADSYCYDCRLKGGYIETPVFWGK
jgi:hypothetical protein